MNLIEAWRLMKPGQSVIRRQGYPDWCQITKGKDDGFVPKGKSNGFAWAIECLEDKHTLANDWEIVKEKKKVKVRTMTALQLYASWLEIGCERLFEGIPNDAVVTFSWEE